MQSNDVQAPCTPTAELLFASPMTKGSSSSSAKADLKDDTLRFIAADIADVPPLLPPERLASPPESPRRKPSMDAFRNALRMVDGLNNSLRQDLLTLVDHLDEKPEAMPVKGSVGITSLMCNSGMVDGKVDTLRTCGSASPTQSDVEAALFGMDTPASTPRSCGLSAQSEISSPRVQDLDLEVSTSHFETTPDAPQNKRFAPASRAEALTPDVEDVQGSRYRREKPLATARDKFKLSIGACERSRQFRSAVLSELCTLTENEFRSDGLA